ncbi:cell surface glycoprotein CD200 receptor, partial [Pristimantis euphronides]
LLSLSDVVTVERDHPVTVRRDHPVTVRRGRPVVVIRGQPVVLQCEADPGDTLLSVIWKLHLYDSSCLVSYLILDNNTKLSYNNCSSRMRSDHLSLSISNTELSDGGNYTCDVAYADDQVRRHTSLQVLALPSTFLELNSDGSPECGASGGIPPVEISWIPHSEDINTTTVKAPDQTWTVLSRLSRERINGNSFTCVISHPTFANPWKGVIVLDGKFMYNILRIIVTVIFTILIVGLLLYLKIKCQ